MSRVGRVTLGSTGRASLVGRRGSLLAHRARCSPALFSSSLRSSTAIMFQFGRPPFSAREWHASAPRWIRRGGQPHKEAAALRAANGDLTAFTDTSIYLATLEEQLLKEGKVDAEGLANLVSMKAADKQVIPNGIKRLVAHAVPSPGDTDNRGFNLLITAFGKWGYVREALLSWERLLAVGQKPDLRAYTSLLHAIYYDLHLRTNDYEDPEENQRLRDKRRKERIWLKKKAFELWDRMNEEGQHPDTLAYTIMIGLCGHPKRKPLSEQPDEDTFRKKQRLREEERVSQGETVVARGEDEVIQVAEVLINQAAQEAKVKREHDPIGGEKEAQEFERREEEREQRERWLHDRAVTLDRAMQEEVSDEETEENLSGMNTALQLMKEMLAHGLKPTARTFHALMETCINENPNNFPEGAKDKGIEMAYDLLLEMQQLKEKDLVVKQRQLVRDRYLKRSKPWLLPEQSKQQNGEEEGEPTKDNKSTFQDELSLVKPTIISFNIFLRGCELAESLDWKRRAFDVYFEQMGVKPDVQTYNSLFHLCIMFEEERKKALEGKMPKKALLHIPNGVALANKLLARFANEKIDMNAQMLRYLARLGVNVAAI
ncbi:hypothetical protein QOT17_002544 [Balamuthia mandrillaris]